MKRWTSETVTVFRQSGWAFGVIIKTQPDTYEWFACHGYDTEKGVSGLAHSMKDAKAAIREYRKLTENERRKA